MYSPKLYLRDRRLASFLAISLAAQGWLWWYLAVHMRPTAQPIFLHYTIIFGVDLLGAWWNVWYVPLAGLAVLIVNNAAAYFMFGRDRLLAYLLAGGAALLQLFAIVISILIVGLNS